MSYTPTEWATGDTITAEKLNKMESGIANAGGGDMFVATISVDAGTGTATADKTHTEIVAAKNAGKLCVINFLGNYAFAFFAGTLSGQADTGAIFATYSYSLFNSAVYVLTIAIEQDNTITQSMAAGTLTQPGS